MLEKGVDSEIVALAFRRACAGVNIARRRRRYRTRITPQTHHSSFMRATQRRDVRAFFGGTVVNAPWPGRTHSKRYGSSFSIERVCSFQEYQQSRGRPSRFHAPATMPGVAREIAPCREREEPDGPRVTRCGDQQRSSSIAQDPLRRSPARPPRGWRRPLRCITRQWKGPANLRGPHIITVRKEHEVGRPFLNVIYQWSCKIA